MVVVVQLVRTPDCGSGGRRFESGLPPKKKPSTNGGFFYLKKLILTYMKVIQKLQGFQFGLFK